MIIVLEWFRDHVYYMDYGLYSISKPMVKVKICVRLSVCHDDIWINS